MPRVHLESKDKAVLDAQNMWFKTDGAERFKRFDNKAKVFTEAVILEVVMRKRDEVPPMGSVILHVDDYPCHVEDIAVWYKPDHISFFAHGISFILAVVAVCVLLLSSIWYKFFPFPLSFVPREVPAHI